MCSVKIIQVDTLHKKTCDYAGLVLRRHLETEISIL